MDEYHAEYTGEQGARVEGAANLLGLDGAAPGTPLEEPQDIEMTPARMTASLIMIGIARSASSNCRVDTRRRRSSLRSRPLLDELSG